MEELRAPLSRFSAVLRQTRNILWRVAAISAFTAGIVGIAVPVVPTVPFLILSAWSASKGWPRFERWLLEHRTYGPHIRRWREGRIVPRVAKVWATVTMFGSILLLLLIDAPDQLLLAVLIVVSAVAVWLWRRPET